MISYWNKKKHVHSFTLSRVFERYNNPNILIYFHFAVKTRKKLTLNFGASRQTSNNQSSGTGDGGAFNFTSPTNRSLTLQLGNAQSRPTSGESTSSVSSTSSVPSNRSVLSDAGYPTQL